jgi:molecular chaperone DnaJ
MQSVDAVSAQTGQSSNTSDASGAAGSLPERDCYEVLGVPRAADGEAIRRAFRRLARELHPDVSALPEAGERFRELSAAYTVLSNPIARSLYDRFGYRGRGNGFGSRRRRSAGHAPILAEVELNTFDAARGTRREVRYPRRKQCLACGGEGAASGSEVGRCDTCNGTGRVRVSSGLGLARWLQVETCPDCESRAASRDCPECGGAGSVTEQRVVNVRIPPGVEDGSRLRVVGEPQDEHILVRVWPLPEDSLPVRILAAVLLVCALALLVYFILKSWAPLGATPLA